MKVLIAEDNYDDRLILKFNLEEHGCEVLEASNGEEGLEMAKVHRPDMIISDALMPGMDGFQFLRALKKDDTLKEIPFIFYSAVYTGYKEAELATSIGAEAFIIKPKEPAELWEEVSAILDELKYRKEKALSAELIKEEEEFLAKYSHVVATKLEEKVKELEGEITERKKAVEALQISELKYRTLFEESKDVIFIATPDGNLLDVNEAGVELFGYNSKEEMPGVNLARDLYWNPADRLKVLKLYDEQGYIKDYEVEMKRRDGEKLNVLVTAVAVKDEYGNTVQYRGMIHDITGMKKLENQLFQAQKMEAVGQLAGGIAHDFNNILTAIIGYAHILKMKMKTDENVKDYADRILLLSDRAAGLTQRLLAFSRKKLITMCHTRLNEIVSNTEQLLSRVIGEYIRLKVQLSDKDLIVMADQVYLEQVLMNLATNARDAMPGGGSLTIATGFLHIDKEFVQEHGFGQEGDYALIIFTDTGTGMDKKTKDRIFEPFFTTKDIGKGTGLGLSMVYGIIKQHEGYISVYSEPGKGTTFRIYLPLVQSMVDYATSESIQPIETGTETILLAEDEPEVREYIKNLLKQYGYSVITAADGREAVNEFRVYSNKIQILLFDVIMPEKSGKEAFDEIKKMSPNARVIFMSGYPADVISTQNIIDEGFAYIEKPASPTKLLRKIREVLK